MTEYFKIMNIDSEYLILSTILRCVLWACVILAVSIDLYHGIKKSKASGEFTNSYGLRRTVDKCNKYLTFLFFMLIGDVFWHIASSSLTILTISVIPIFTLFGSMVLVYNEWVSVREKVDQKMLNKINKSKDELLSIAFNVAEAYRRNPDALKKIIDEGKSIEEKKERRKEVETMQGHP